ncbi:MAG: tRNA (N(6)-L-threonylcarbamoyladenosine(37)-C(2))-methylthiotransferase MtaB [Pirellulaceae bacterium]
MGSLRTLTLGCKVNQYETEFVRQGLVSAGYVDADEDAPADLCIINTCTVTNEGDAKSRQVIRKMARQNPAARIVVMGCYATRAPDELASLPQVVEVVTDKRELPDLLGRFGVVDIPDGISSFGDRHRAYVKVQDGCLLRCSYCIIPKVRPDMHSRPMASILDEIRRLADNGYKEMVLTGIHLGHYGVDWNWNKPKEQWIRLSHLLKAAVQIPGDFRLRLSSIEATEVTRELLQVMAEHADRVCPHLHLCLQSGSDAVLKRMRRRWGTKRFIDRCQLAKEYLDLPAITTDVIVGFPGETDEEFQQTLDTCRSAGFSKIHIFPFSVRKGTPAADMPNQVTKQVKSERGRRLADLEQELRHDYFQSLVGQPLEVLWEMQKDNRMAGTSCRYAPCLSAESASNDRNSLPPDGTRQRVQVQQVSDGRLVVG